LNLPKGYLYSALYAGIRKVAKPDLGLIVSETSASAAGVYTTNRVQAAPVRLCRAHLEASHGLAQAILVNAGNANAATRTGDAVAAETAESLAAALGCATPRVLVASTGVIGVELDPGLIVRALPRLVNELAPDCFLDVAQAICTTDTAHKAASIQHQGIRVAGMTKGAGMIQPNMATTLGFVLTDAVLSPAKTQSLLKKAVERSYHRISVDGDTSTNDTVLLLANGASGKRPGPGFEDAVIDVFEALAKQIARDGEGARKLITIDVEGARGEEAAVRIARAIANSPLVKTAIAGSDANWGRIICAAGYSGVDFDPAKVDIWLQDVKVCVNGLAAEFDEADLKTRLDEPNVSIRLKIAGAGKGAARFWTCDLTEDYIKINASYRT
jgi:glutamate N-acetyltransferase/amino-acid N-acetyltransferase